jgi:hypothetical protein
VKVEELDAAAEVEMAAAAAAAATAEEYEEMLRVVEAIATRIRWRLRPHSKRRLLNGGCQLIGSICVSAMEGLGMVMLKWLLSCLN